MIDYERSSTSWRANCLDDFLFRFSKIIRRVEVWPYNEGFGHIYVLLTDKA